MRGLCYLSLIILCAAVLVTAIISIYAKTPIIDKDYVHDISLDANQRFPSSDAFRTFIQKYDPVTSFENVDSLAKNRGRNYTVVEQVDLVLQGIDPTDDLLKLRVQNGNPRVLALSSSRRQFGQQPWTPPAGTSHYPKDFLNYKPRLYELMKQAIYQARNKMVLMQLMRDKFRTQQMYKMGYLMSKTDNACKVFNKVALHAYRNCHRMIIQNPRTRVGTKFRMYEVQVSHMRVLHLWFQAELLTDLIIRNDIYLHEAYEVKGVWNFTD